MNEQHTYRLKSLLIAAGITELLWWAIFIPVWIQIKDDPTFRFERDDILFGFLLIPILIGVFYYVYNWKNNALRRFSDLNLVGVITQEVSNSGLITKYIATRLALGMLIIAGANPQYGEGEIEAKAEGAEIMFVVDVSRSMEAMDLSDKRSRLDIAKLAMNQLVGKLDGDHVGVVAFAVDAFLHLPITEDYAGAKLFIDQISTGMISAQGTSIGRAIETALESFDFDNEMKKGIILISDGENHEGTAMSQAKQTKEKGVTIHTVGMGSPRGSTIPVYNNNGVKTGIMKDAQGNTVLTKLNEQMLRQIASTTGGSYVKATETSLGLDFLKDQIDKIEKTEYASEKYSDYDDQFQWFLGAGILFILVEMLVSTGRNNYRPNLKLFDQ